MGFKKATKILFFLLFLHFLAVHSRHLREASGDPNLQAPAAQYGDGFAGKTQGITVVVRKGGGGARGGGSRGGGSRGGGGGGGGRGYRGGGGARVIPFYGAGSHRRGQNSTGWSLKPGSRYVGLLGLSVLAGLVFLF